MMAKLKAKLKKYKGKLKPKSYKEKKVDISHKTITINGVEYIEKGAVSSAKQFEGPIKIVVLQRGWVLVGKFERKGDQCFLHNAHVIRNWGTTKGLGELAKDGPTVNTKIDPCNGVVEFEALTKVLDLSVNQELWAKKL
jgi:hypothetical protein